MKRFNCLLPGLCLIFFLCCTMLSLSQPTKKQRTILFIGAHPDDETAIGETLARYARQGNKVYIIIATDGKDGTRVTKIPAGDSLGRLRKLETTCSCEKLGIEPPIFFSIERLDTKIGVRNYFNAHKQFMDSLRVRIPALKPDIIIAQGPDGDTHHSEHIVAGSAVTELLLAEGWVDKYPLYYFAWEKGSVGVDEFGYVDKQYFNVQVSYTEEDENRAIESLKCYVTQYTEKEMAEQAANTKKDTKNKSYFRRFTTQKGLKTDF